MSDDQRLEGTHQMHAARPVVPACHGANGDLLHHVRGILNMTPQNDQGASFTVYKGLADKSLQDNWSVTMWVQLQADSSSHDVYALCSLPVTIQGKQEHLEVFYQPSYRALYAGISNHWYPPLQANMTTPLGDEWVHVTLAWTTYKVAVASKNGLDVHINGQPMANFSFPLKTQPPPVVMGQEGRTGYFGASPSVGKKWSIKKPASSSSSSGKASYVVVKPWVGGLHTIRFFADYLNFGDAYTSQCEHPEKVPPAQWSAAVRHHYLFGYVIDDKDAHMDMSTVPPSTTGYASPLTLVGGVRVTLLTRSKDEVLHTLSMSGAAAQTSSKPTYDPDGKYSVAARTQALHDVHHEPYTTPEPKKPPLQSDQDKQSQKKTKKTLWSTGLLSLVIVLLIGLSLFLHRKTYAMVREEIDNPLPKQPRARPGRETLP